MLLRLNLVQKQRRAARDMVSFHRANARWAGTQKWPCEFGLLAQENVNLYFFAWEFVLHDHSDRPGREALASFGDKDMLKCHPFIYRCGATLEDGGVQRPGDPTKRSLEVECSGKDQKKRKGWRKSELK